MYIAETTANKVYLADQEGLSRKIDFRCPGCKQPVFLKKGQRMIPHFSHYKEQACTIFSEGETHEHLSGKKQLKDWLIRSNEQVKLEAYLPKLMQRPDILWTTKEGKKIALEFQCSPLPADRMVERTHCYKQAGYNVIWILGERFRIQKRLTPFHRLCMTSIQNEIVLLHYSVKEKRLARSYYFMDHEHSMLRFSRDHFPTTEAWEKLFQQGLRQEESARKTDFQEEHKGLQRAAYHKVPKTRPFFRQLYENGESMITIPLELYGKTAYAWMIDQYTYAWKYQCLRWIESFPRKRVITKNMICRWVRENEKYGRLTFYRCPMLTDDLKSRPITAFLDHLTQTKILKKNKKEKWTVSQKAKRFQTIEEKMHTFRRIE